MNEKRAWSLKTRRRTFHRNKEEGEEDVRETRATSNLEESCLNVEQGLP